MSEACENCKFYKKDSEVDVEDLYEGYCHRFPPALFLDGDHEIYWFSPRTGSSTWCGEYKPA